MSMIGLTPVEKMMREQAAREKARQDWAYSEEISDLKKRLAEAEASIARQPEGLRKNLEAYFNRH